MKEDLTKQATRGVIWVSISQISTQSFQFIITIILARLLVPEDFGIVGTAGIFTGFVVCINNLGFSAAIIQKDIITEKHLSTSFWASVLLAIVLYISTLGLSSYIANFFNKDLVKPVIHIIAIGFILGSLGAVQRSLLTRELDFKSLAFVDIANGVSYGVAALLLAFMGYGVWSLVYGGIFSDVIATIMLWIICKWKPKFIFNYRSFKELFSFGIYVMGQSIVNYFSSNVDYLMISRFLGQHLLGIYTIAYSLMMFPLKRLSSIITRVTFPVFSSIQDDNNRLRKGYLMTVQYLSVITFPLLSGLLIVAPEFIRVVYSEKWNEVIVPLQIMCIAGMLKSIGTTVGTVQYAKKRADIGFKWNLVELSILTGAIFIGKNFGIIGVAIAITITTIVMEPIIQLITNRLIDLKFSIFIASLAPASICSAVMICLVFLNRRIFSSVLLLSDAYVLIGSVSIGIIVYVLILRICFKNIFYEMLNIFPFYNSYENNKV